ncbi:Na(+)/serine-threonine symporter [Aggregatibacter aphrophilus]|uniref:Na(+)/serine-threonine symporter n=1 Tax=Aggregatibacter aphrophilus TaxID=732 RepID=A0A336N1Q1_AGGAP|nr:Na(+)/serine-threonine symporter [Aggregatibacter aphrophilus]
MNISRLISLFFQGNLVKRIAIGLLFGIIVAQISSMLQPALGFNLAEKVGVLGQIFVRSLRAVAPLLIFVLVMAAIANKKSAPKLA